MSLSDALSVEGVMHGGPSCMTCVAREQMTLDDLEAFDSACQNNLLTSAAIVRACNREGIQGVTVGSLRRHRRGECLARRTDVG